MNLQSTMRELVIQLVDLVLTPTGAGFFFGPLLLLFFIVRFLKWVVAVGRGTPDIEELGEQYTEYRGRIDRLPQRVKDTFRRRY